MANKRGQEQLYMNVFYLVITVILLFSMIYFANDLAEGRAFEKQLTAKKIALILDAAQPGTKIILNSDKIEIEQKDERLYVRTKDEKKGYEYMIYNPYVIKIGAEEGDIIIEVKNE